MQSVQRVGQSAVAYVFEFSDSEKPAGAPGMAGDEDQLVFLRARRAPLEVMLDFGRLAVFINAEQADVQIEPGIFKVVRVAPVKRDLLFRREDEAHVGVFLETVEVILATLIQRDHVAAEAGFVE